VIKKRTAGKLYLALKPFLRPDVKIRQCRFAETLIITPVTNLSLDICEEIGKGGKEY
jgi:hypothetical protein